VDLIVLINANPKYHQGIRTLFDLGDFLYVQTQDVTGTITRDKPHTQKLEEHTKELVAEFSGRKTLELFLVQLENLTTVIRNDVEAREYLDEFRDFILERHPEAHESEEFRRNTRALIEKGRRIVDRLNNVRELRSFLDTADQLIENIKNDELLVNLRDKAGILREEFTYVDSDGTRKVDMELIQNIQKVIVPILADALKYIPIPRVEYNDKKMYLMAQNIIFSGYDIVPENVFAHVEADSWFSFKELETQKSKSKLVLSLRNIRTEVKDVEFAFKRKKFPVIEDSGRVTFRVRGAGANLTIVLYIVQFQSESVARFENASVDFDISKLDVEFDKSSIKHDTLLPLATKLFKKQIKRSIERAVEKNLEPALNSLGRKLTENLKQSSLVTQMDKVKNTLKDTDTHQVLQSRHEKLSS